MMIPPPALKFHVDMPLRDVQAPAHRIAGSADRAEPMLHGVQFDLIRTQRHGAGVSADQHPGGGGDASAISPMPAQQEQITVIVQMQYEPVQSNRTARQRQIAPGMFQGQGASQCQPPGSLPHGSIASTIE